MRINAGSWKGRIAVKSDDYIDSVMSTIPGCKWNKNSCLWHLPMSPYSIWRLVSHEEIEDVEFSSSLNGVISEASDLEAGVAAKNRKYHGDCAGQFDTATTPWSHQIDAFDFISNKECSYLAMDCGTGKTLVAIQDILATKAMKVLILCPKCVIPVWPNELKIHAPGYAMAVAALNKGTGKKKLETAKQLNLMGMVTGRPFVLVVNYESAWRDPLSEFILKEEWDYVVFDEIHKIKKPGGKASRFCAKLVRNSKKRLGLSGTPLPNNKLDAYGQCRALDPGIFGTVYATYRNRYAEMEVYNEHIVSGWRNSEEFNNILNLLMFRVDKEVLDLPPVVHQYVEVPLSAKARKMYKQMEDDFVTSLGVDQYISASNALARMVRLAQITSGTVFPVDGDGIKLNPEVIDTGKESALKEVVSSIGAKEKIVVFCRFRHELSNIERITNDLGRRYKEMSGTRKELDGDRFPDGGDVLGIQLQSGGIGINLSDSAYCIYYSLTFSLADFIQSESRVHRGGQSRKVTYIHILAEDTIDGVIYKALREKKKVVDEVVNYIKQGGRGV